MEHFGHKFRLDFSDNAGRDLSIPSFSMLTIRMILRENLSDDNIFCGHLGYSNENENHRISIARIASHLYYVSFIRIFIGCRTKFLNDLPGREITVMIVTFRLVESLPMQIKQQQQILTVISLRTTLKLRIWQTPIFVAVLNLVEPTLPITEMSLPASKPRENICF